MPENDPEAGVYSNKQVLAYNQCLEWDKITDSKDPSPKKPISGNKTYSSSLLACPLNAENWELGHNNNQDEI